MMTTKNKKYKTTFESTYGIGQKFWSIDCAVTPNFVECPICKGELKAYFKNGNALECRKCDGGKVYGVPTKRWYVTGPFTIGQIRLIATADFMEPETDSEKIVMLSKKPIIEEEYMCHETGVIGGGQIHKDFEYIFPTKQAAQKECNRRNKEIEK